MAAARQHSVFQLPAVDISSRIVSYCIYSNYLTPSSCICSSSLVEPAVLISSAAERAEASVLGNYSNQTRLELLEPLRKHAATEKHRRGVLKKQKVAQIDFDVISGR